MGDSLLSPNSNYNKLERCVNHYIESDDELTRNYDNYENDDYINENTADYCDISVENVRNIDDEEHGVVSRFGSITQTISMDTQIIVYETNNNNNNDEHIESTHRFYGKKTLKSDSFECEYNSELDIIEYEHKIRSLSSDNRELNAQLLQMEEQITDLIREKQNLCFTINSQKQFLLKKIAAKDEEIDELTQHLLHFEDVNSKLEQLLDIKSKEKANLQLKIEEMEDKLSHAEFQLSDAQKSESELINACNDAKQAFTVEESDKYTAVQQLHNAFLQCAEQQIQIINLQDTIDTLNQIISDQRTERWFSRHIDSEYSDFTKNLSQEFDEISSSSNMQSNRTEETIVVTDSSLNLPSKHTDITNKEDVDDNGINSLAHNDSSHQIELNQISDNLNASLTDDDCNQNLIECVDLSDAINGFRSIIALITGHRIGIIIAIILFIILAFIVSLMTTNLPPYTSWEEIIYRIFLPYVSKEKVSKTQ